MLYWWLLLAYKTLSCSFTTNSLIFLLSLNPQGFLLVSELKLWLLALPTQIYVTLLHSLDSVAVLAAINIVMMILVMVYVGFFLRPDAFGQIPLLEALMSHVLALVNQDALLDLVLLVLDLWLHWLELIFR